MNGIFIYNQILCREAFLPLKATRPAVEVQAFITSFNFRLNNALCLQIQILFQ